MLKNEQHEEPILVTGHSTETWENTRMSLLPELRAWSSAAWGVVVARSL